MTAGGFKLLVGDDGDVLELSKETDAQCQQHAKTTEWTHIKMYLNKAIIKKVTNELRSFKMLTTLLFKLHW